MTLKELKKAFKENPLPVQLLSQEGDIYLCQVDRMRLLRNNDGSPAIFHSISEAKETLGDQIAHHLQLVYSETYDEMIHPESETKPSK
ncbi:DUF6482 family protein [Endozoicomonas sp. ONNA2]|uniref:DUF6482 family protein n=1 Tax=Endozoicomonas sp. ONNA2 TaxID=2828741 RepID=UPI0021473A07|nr:DUF6482 family protein [Endozoicomonas sp. ONNA2]